MKILCSDYDGTLSYGGIDEKKLEAIRAWRRKGNKFGIISGRRTDFYHDLKKAQPNLELDFMATCNGTVILDGEGKLLIEERCTSVPTKEAVRDFLSWGSDFVFINGIDEDPDDFLCVATEEKDLPSWVDPAHTVLLDHLPAIQCFRQLTAVVEPEEKAPALTERIRKAYGDRLNPLHNGRCIDIVPVGINKAEGIRRIMKHFGVRFDDMIAVGDNGNDADMLREFRSYAMANGVDSIRALANGIVSDVTEIFEIEG